MNESVDFLKESPGQRVEFCSRRDEFSGAVTDLLRGSMSAALFTGRSSAMRCGAYDAIAAGARAAGCRLELFSDIEPEPSVETVDKMRSFLTELVPDIVLAAGGGSVLDAAKAAWLTAQTKWELERHFGVDKYSSVDPGGELRRIVAIPTTSGTGSECTAYSNIVDREHGVKKLISERLTVPEVALVHPEFTVSMPRHVTLATGCDALAHLIEGVLNVRADANHPRANDWAMAGIRLIREALPKVLHDSEDGKARRKMSLAAALGGMVIRHKSTGLPHLCSFSWFGRIEHGIAAVLLLPEAWRYYLAEPSVAERTMMLSEVFGGETPDAVVAGFRAFLDSLGAPESLACFPEITPELLRKTAASGRENKMKLELAPRPVPLERSEEILTGILEAAYRRNN